MQGDELALLVRRAFGKLLLRPVGGLFEIVFLFQLPKQALGLLFLKLGAAEQRVALAHVLRPFTSVTASTATC